MAELRIDIHAEAHLKKMKPSIGIATEVVSSRGFFKRSKTLAAIQNSPVVGRVLHGTRRYLLKRFPYVVVYRVAAPH